jgi:hypothetical protein
MHFEPVILSLPQRKILNDIIDRGPKESPRVFLSRALLWLDRSPDGPALEDFRVGETLRLSPQSVKEIKTLFNQNGLEAALAFKPPPRSENFRWHKNKRAIEEKLLALASSQAPDGRDRWSVRLLAEEAVGRRLVDSISHTTIHRILRKKEIRLDKTTAAV